MMLGYTDTTKIWRLWDPSGGSNGRGRFIRGSEVIFVETQNAINSAADDSNQPDEINQTKSTDYSSQSNHQNPSQAMIPLIFRIQTSQAILRLSTLQMHLKIKSMMEILSLWHVLIKINQSIQSVRVRLKIKSMMEILLSMFGTSCISRDI